MTLKTLVGIAVSCGLITGPALAHPGSVILSLGGKTERTAMSEGVSFEEKNGVHLFRGGQTASSSTALQGGATRNMEIEIRKHRTSFRSIRSLRTQGFYSGAGPKSRRYTQGFYSGD